MSHLTQHINNLMKRLNLPEEAVKTFTEVEGRLDRYSDFAERFDELTNDYMADKLPLDLALAAITEISREFSENVYTLDFVFLLNCTEELYKRYKENGISDNIYYDTMDDLRCKLLECMECEGVPGTFVPSWYDGFFKMNRFALGRFQYEMSDFNCEGGYTTKSGHYLEHGSPIVNFHIPSSGISLTDEVRYDSYRRAFDYFKGTFGGGPVVFCCSSWLLFPEHDKFLPKSSNILRFMHDFEIVRSRESDDFGNGWRVFGRKSDLPIEQLPRDTALRRAYAEWMEQGNKTGSAYGVIIFDGEKIIT